MYIKPHHSSGAHGTGAIQPGCGLFVTGLPYTHQDLREVMQQLFSSFGPVRDIAMHATKVTSLPLRACAAAQPPENTPTLESCTSPNGKICCADPDSPGRAVQTSAIVVFAEAPSCRKVLEAAQGASLVQLHLQPPEQPFGLKGKLPLFPPYKGPNITPFFWSAAVRGQLSAVVLWAAWVEEHKACFPGNGALAQQLDAWMEEFEAGEARRKADAAAALTEDGWTVVKRRGVRVPAQGRLDQSSSASNGHDVNSLFVGCQTKYLKWSPVPTCWVLRGQCANRAARRCQMEPGPLWGQSLQLQQKPLQLGRRWVLTLKGEAQSMGVVSCTAPPATPLICACSCGGRRRPWWTSTGSSNGISAVTVGVPGADTSFFHSMTNASYREVTLSCCASRAHGAAAEVCGGQAACRRDEGSAQVQVKSLVLYLQRLLMCYMHCLRMHCTSPVAGMVSLPKRRLCVNVTQDIISSDTKQPQCH